MKRLALLLLVGCASAPKSPEGVTQHGEVRGYESAPRHVSPNGEVHITLLARGQNAFLGKLRMEPGASVPEHQDPTEEYIHVLSGHAVMTMDGTRYDIAPGTTVYMPAFAKVSVQNGDEALEAIQVFAGPLPADKYATWPRSE